MMPMSAWDIIYQRLGGKGKAWVNLIGTLLFFNSRMFDGHHNVLEVLRITPGPYWRDLRIRAGFPIASSSKE